MLSYLALVVCLEGASPMAPASTVASHAPPARAEAKLAARQGHAAPGRRSPSAPADAPFAINAASRVELNGRPCRFEDVPDGAVIIRIEVEASTRAIVRVHFRTAQ